MTKLEYPPLFRLYELEIKPEKKAEFVALGQRNLSLSIKTEPQTLAMAVSRDGFRQVRPADE